MQKVKASERQRERMNKPKTDWKESRLVVAALSVAGTATFMSTVVMPITNASLHARLEALAPAEEKIRSLKSEVDALNKRALVAESNAAQAIKDTPFLPGSPYPTGLDKVIAGSPESEVIKEYPKGTWDEERSYYSVDTNHPFISRATYYFTDSKEQKRKVAFILFHLKSDSGLSASGIRDRFTILFGQPTYVGPKDRAMWRTSSRESAEFSRENNFVIREGSYVPHWAQVKKN
jgi:hypothetical protein